MCLTASLRGLGAAFPKTPLFAGSLGLVLLASWVEYLDLCRIQFSMQLRRKSREEIGGSVGSASCSGGSMIMQSDNDPQSLSESDCSHTQGPGDGEVEDG